MTGAAIFLLACLVAPAPARQEQPLAIEVRDGVACVEAHHLRRALRRQHPVARSAGAQRLIVEPGDARQVVVRLLSSDGRSLGYRQLALDEGDCSVLPETIALMVEAWLSAAPKPSPPLPAMAVAPPSPSEAPAPPEAAGEAEANLPAAGGARVPEAPAEPLAAETTPTAAASPPEAPVPAAGAGSAAPPPATEGAEPVAVPPSEAIAVEASPPEGGGAPDATPVAAAGAPESEPVAAPVPGAAPSPPSAEPPRFPAAGSEPAPGHQVFLAGFAGGYMLGAGDFFGAQGGGQLGWRHPHRWGASLRLTVGSPIGAQASSGSVRAQELTLDLCAELRQPVARGATLNLLLGPTLHYLASGSEGIAGARSVESFDVGVAGLAQWEQALVSQLSLIVGVRAGVRLHEDRLQLAGSEESESALRVPGFGLSASVGLSWRLH